MWPAASQPEPDTRTATTKAEDDCAALYASLPMFDRATLYWLLNRDGWTCEKALHVRRRGAVAVLLLVALLGASAVRP